MGEALGEEGSIQGRGKPCERASTRAIEGQLRAQLRARIGYGPLGYLWEGKAVWEGQGAVSLLVRCPVLLVGLVM